MTLAQSVDVAVRLGRELTTDEQDRVEGLLEEASVMVTEFCRGRAFDPVPNTVRVVTSRVAARALVSHLPHGSGVQSTTLQSLSFQQTHTYNPDATSGGVYLSRADRRQLRRWSRSGAYSFDTR